MYGGLLIIYASINAFPLKTVAKLARIGPCGWLQVQALIQVMLHCVFRTLLLHASSIYMVELSSCPILLVAVI